MSGLELVWPRNSAQLIETERRIPGPIQILTCDIEMKLKLLTLLVVPFFSFGMIGCTGDAETETEEAAEETAEAVEETAEAAEEAVEEAAEEVKEATE